MTIDTGHRLAAIEKRVKGLERTSRLASASLDDTSLQVRSGDSLRGIVGVQADGTTAVTIVNGPPPPAPSTPAVAPALGGIAATWDGTFAGGAVSPMDWARVEVHASAATGFTPDSTTLQATIETPQGATVYIPATAARYVLLLARNTSGAASAPSAQAGPVGPTPVVADDVLDGIVTTVKLADDAVTAAKVATAAINADGLAANAVTAAAIAADAVTATAIASGAVGNTEISDGAISTPKLTAGVVTANELAAAAVTAGKIATGAVIAGKLDANSVTAGNIAAAAVQAGNLAANSVQAGNIAADSVQAGNIAANAVTARELNALAVTAGKIATNAVTAGTIAAGAVTAASLTVGIAQSIAEKLNDAMADSSLWSQVSGTGSPSWLTGVSDASAGSTVMQANAYVTLERQVNIPYDPEALYRVTVRTRVLTAPTSGGAIALGLSGIAADGTTRVNTTGANSTSLQHFVAASGVTIAAGTAWTTYTGYIKGTAATGTGTACPDPKAPGAAHTSVRYVRPLVRLLLNSTDGVAQVDQVTVETLPTGVVNTVNIADGAITTPKLTAGSVDATALSATAITGKTITGGTISGTTVTGGTIQTSATNPAMRITSSDNYLRFYNSAGTATVAIGGTTGSASLTGSLDTGLSTGARMHISADSFDGGSVEWKPDPTATQVNHNAQVYATYGSILDPNSGTTTIVAPDVTPVGFVGESQPIINLSSFRDGTPTQLFARADGAALDFPKGMVLGSYMLAGHGHSAFTAETWQTPTTYGSGWSAATAVGTLTPMPALRYRLGIEDTVILEGSFTAASTGTPATAVVTLPTGYKPAANSAPFPVACRTSAGAVTTMWMYLSAAGNLNINSQTGSSVTLGATYSLPRTHISLGNIS